MNKQLKKVKEDYILNRVNTVFKKLYKNDEYKKINNELTKKSEEIENIIGFKLMNEYTELKAELLGYSDDEIYKVGFKDGVNMIFDTLLSNE